jgi:hypothetical protein
MFEIIPFERRNNQVSSYDPFRAFDEMERSFFKNSLTEFRTDVSDNGDSFLVEAELPGFNKEDIHIDIVNAGDRKGRPYVHRRKCGGCLRGVEDAAPYVLASPVKGRGTARRRWWDSLSFYAG